VRHGSKVRLLIVGMAAVRAAVALPAQSVALEVADSCTSVDRAQLSRLLDVEQRRDAERALGSARVVVTCEADLVTLRVEQRADAGRPRARTFNGADVSGEVGARVLALAAIELLKPEPEPELEPDRPPPIAAPPSVPVAARTPAASVRLMVDGSVQTFGFAPPLFGGGLSVDYLRLSKLGLRLGFDVAMAERDYELGRAHVQLTTLNAQAGYLALYDDWMVRAFVGYRFGAGRISGQAPRSVVTPVGTVAGAWGGPLLSGGLGLRSGGWVAELGAEAGLVSFPLEGTVAEHDPIELKRYWLGLSLNVGALL
jgi:hypothetical protein